METNTRKRSASNLQSKNAKIVVSDRKSVSTHHEPAHAKANRAIAVLGRNGIPHITGSIKTKHFSEMYLSIDKIKTLVLNIAPIVCAHPSFEDIDWPVDSTIIDVLNHLLNEFKRLMPSHLQLVFRTSEIEGQDLVPYAVFELTDCYTNGNIVPCEFLSVIQFKNPQLFKILIQYFGFIHHSMGISLWNGYLEEMISNHLEDMAVETYGDHAFDDDENHQSIEQNEDDIENALMLQEILEEVYEVREAAGLATMAYQNFSGIGNLTSILTSYHPKQNHTKQLKAWMLRGLAIKEGGFYFDHYARPDPEMAEDLYSDSCCPPEEYLSFTWTTNGHFGNELSESLNCRAGEGIIPLHTSYPITKELFQEIDTARYQEQNLIDFYDWMSDAHQLFENFLNTPKP